MAQTASNVTAGKPAVGGALYRAPIGTALPTNATTALGDAFTPLGYMSEDGLTNDNTMESEDLKAWGGDPVLNLQTSKTDTFTGTLIEALNPDVLKTVYGEDNVSGTLATGITVYATADEATDYVYVCDMIMRGGALKRIILPNAKVTAIGTITYSDKAAVGYNLTLTAASATVNDKQVTHVEYIHAAAA